MKITTLMHHPMERFNHLKPSERKAAVEPRNETHFIAIPYLV
ncbi:hypothetical protein [Paenibacillus xylanivorans]|nr:hypothetical protein [Paenibacillus xylanivorans]